MRKCVFLQRYAFSVNFVGKAASQRAQYSPYRASTRAHYRQTGDAELMATVMVAALRETWIWFQICCVVTSVRYRGKWTVTNNIQAVKKCAPVEDLCFTLVIQHFSKHISISVLHNLIKPGLPIVNWTKKDTCSVQVSREWRRTKFGRTVWVLCQCQRTDGLKKCQFLQ